MLQRKYHRLHHCGLVSRAPRCHRCASQYSALGHAAKRATYLDGCSTTYTHTKKREHTHHSREVLGRADRMDEVPDPGGREERQRHVHSDGRRDRRRLLRHVWGTLYWKSRVLSISECASVKEVYLTPRCLRSALDPKVACAVRANFSREIISWVNTKQNAQIHTL
jgi:hypothetical protein